jgi:hypothetical protein
MRGISTVVDVAVFLLLVSAAVLTLSLAPGAPPEDLGADETAELLASSTATVGYELHGAGRRAHGTVGGLLARAAVANASIGGRELSTASDGFERLVRHETRRLLAAPHTTRVTVRWAPYPDAPVRGTVRVGTRPPPTADVQLATVTVPAAIPAARPGTTAAAGYERIATATAESVADGFLPADRFRAAWDRDGPASRVTARRLATLASATGAPVEAELDAGNVSAARERVTAALGRRLAADMRQQFDSPADAAGAVRTATATVTVRRWKV